MSQPVEREYRESLTIGQKGYPDLGRKIMDAFRPMPDTDSQIGSEHNPVVHTSTSLTEFHTATDIQESENIPTSQEHIPEYHISSIQDLTDCVHSFDTIRHHNKQEQSSDSVYLSSRETMDAVLALAQAEDLFHTPNTYSDHPNTYLQYLVRRFDLIEHIVANRSTLPENGRNMGVETWVDELSEYKQYQIRRHRTGDANKDQKLSHQIASDSTFLTAKQITGLTAAEWIEAADEVERLNLLIHFDNTNRVDTVDTKQSHIHIESDGKIFRIPAETAKKIADDEHGSRKYLKHYGLSTRKNYTDAVYAWERETHNVVFSTDENAPQRPRPTFELVRNETEQLQQRFVERIRTELQRRDRLSMRNTLIDLMSRNLQNSIEFRGRYMEKIREGFEKMEDKIARPDDFEEFPIIFSGESVEATPVSRLERGALTKNRVPVEDRDFQRHDAARLREREEPIDFEKDYEAMDWAARTRLPVDQKVQIQEEEKKIPQTVDTKPDEILQICMVLTTDRGFEPNAMHYASQWIRTVTNPDGKQTKIILSAPHGNNRYLLLVDPQDPERKPTGSISLSELALITGKKESDFDFPEDDKWVGKMARLLSTLSFDGKKIQAKNILFDGPKIQVEPSPAPAKMPNPAPKEPPLERRSEPMEEQRVYRGADADYDRIQHNKEILIIFRKAWKDNAITGIAITYDTDNLLKKVNVTYLDDGDESKTISLNAVEFAYLFHLKHDKGNGGLKSMTLPGGLIVQHTEEHEIDGEVLAKGFDDLFSDHKPLGGSPQFRMAPAPVHQKSMVDAQ